MEYRPPFLGFGRCLLAAVGVTAWLPTFNPPFAAQEQAAAIAAVAQTGHQDKITAVALSADGQYVVTASEDSTIVLWEFATRRQVRQFRGHAGAVTSLAVSKDVDRVLSGSRDGTLRLWDGRTGETLRAFARDASLLDRIRNADQPGGTTAPAPINAVALDPQGRYAASAEQDGAFLTELKTGARRRLRSGFLGAHRIPYGSVAFDPSGKFVAAGCEHPTCGDVRLFDVESGEVIGEFKGHTAAVRAVTFSRKGDLLFTGSADKSVRVWNVGDRSQLEAIPFNSPVVALAVSGDGRRLVASVESGETSIVERGAGKKRVPLNAWNAHVTALAVSADDRLVVGGCTGVALIWRLDTGEMLGGFQGYARAAEAIAASDDAIVVSAGTKLWHWDLRAGRVTHGYLGHTGAVLAAAMSRDGRYLVTGAADNTARLWDARTGTQLAVLGHATPVVAVALSGDGERAISASTDGTCMVWALAPYRNPPAGSPHQVREVLHQLHLGSRVSAVALDEHGTRALTADLDRLRLWSGSERWEPESLKRENSADFSIGTAVAFSPGGEYVLAGSYYGEARLWNTDTRQELRVFPGHRGPVNAVAFAPGADLAFTAGDDQVVRAWMVRTREKREIPAPGGAISGLVAFRGGRFLATASRDGTSRLWDVENRALVATLVLDARGDAARPAWLCVGPGGRFDTSDLESVQSMHWVADDDPMRALPVEIFMRDYFEPRLLPRLLAGERLPALPPLAALNRLQPTVEIERVRWIDAAEGRAVVTVKVAGARGQVARNGKPSTVTTDAYDLRVFRDGQLVGGAPVASAEWQRQRPGSGSREDDLRRWRALTHITLGADGTSHLDFPVRVPRRAGAKGHTITAYAFNEDRVKSETAAWTETTPAALVARPGTAYVITVGVNRTESSPAWDLKYASNDARVLSEVLTGRLREGRRFADVVPIKLVSDSGGPRADEGRATREQLHIVLEALAGPVETSRLAAIPGAQRLKPAAPEDVVFLAVSSHGYTDARGVFHMVLADIGPGRPPEVTPELEQRTLTSDELSAWLRKVDAGELVLIVDACHSEATVNADGFKPGPMGSRGLGQLAYDKGMRVLAASRAQETAVERGGKVQQGLLTYVLREGLVQPRADVSPKDNAITLREWLAYTVERVPEVFVEGDARGSVAARDAPDLARDGFLGRRRTAARYQQPVLFEFSRNGPELVLWSW